MASTPLKPDDIPKLVEAERVRLEAEEALEAEREKHYSKTYRKLMKRTEDKLTPQMRARRDAFIEEFLVDFNGPAAIIRSGGSVTTAGKMSSEFQREPYVAKRIREAIDALEEAKVISRQRVLAGLVREANFQGSGASHGARVSAFKVLADILGMEAPKTVKNEHTVKGGVMMVPMVGDGSVDDWEKSTQQAQEQLKEDVKK